MKRLLATIRKGSRTIQALLSLVLLLVLWWGVTAAGLVNPLYLPSPQSVWSAFVEANSCRPQSPGSSRIICGEQQYFLWQHLVVSLERIGIGMLLAIIVGMLVGFLLAEVEWLNRIVLPYINFIRALPPLGYIGLLIVWFGIATPPRSGCCSSPRSRPSCSPPWKASKE